MNSFLIYALLRRLSLGLLGSLLAGRLLLTLLLAVVVLRAFGTQPQDSLETAVQDADSTCRFQARQLVLPSALVAAGAFGVHNGWMHSLRRNVRHGVETVRGDHYFHADDYVQYVPILANVGLELAGVEARHPLRERVAVTLTGYAAMAVMVQGGKRLFRERRPDSSGRTSFPSGHSATAFFGAELVRTEYGGAYGIGAYALACGIGVMRMYNDRHWLNDVVAGAGIGILGARMGYWLLPLERKWFKWDRQGGAAVSAFPTYVPETRTVGLGLVASW